jgi:Family of unknown function (DUF5758)
MSLRDGKIKPGTIVWKSVSLWTEPATGGGVSFAGRAIVKLVVLEEGLVPRKHRRGTWKDWENGHRKCRVPKAYVASIEPIVEGTLYTTARSHHDFSFKYGVGHIVSPKAEFNPDPKICCASGIHVFLTREEAGRYV